MSKPFKIPKAFLTQLEEFTNGYHLIFINANNEFETIMYHPNDVAEMALLNYADIQASSVQEILRQRTIEKGLSDDEDEATSD